VVVAAVAVSPRVLAQPPAGGPDPAPVRPAYDATGALHLPDGYQRWIIAGASLGLSYGDSASAAPLFHQVLIEPTAYRHFVATGEFRDGTMFALLLQSPTSGVLPGRHGQFAGALRTVEMAVKDSARTPERWAYYNFGGRDGLRPTAQPQARATCYECHAEHAARDNVFVQFYPLLAAAAPATRTTAPSASGGTPREPPAPVGAPLALRGLDPVLLAEGREEAGKAEIVAEHKGHRYQFLSEPTWKRFTAAPDRYAIQNDTCPVVPGAPIDPGLFAVHRGRVYALATEQCVRDFTADPTRYVKD